MVFGLMFFTAPMPLVVLACGSISTSSTLRPAAARYVARLIAVVVLPTPPFWFVMAYTFDTGYFRTFHLSSRLALDHARRQLSAHEKFHGCSVSIYAIVTNARLISNYYSDPGQGCCKVLCCRLRRQEKVRRRGHLALRQGADRPLHPVPQTEFPCFLACYCRLCNCP